MAGATHRGPYAFPPEFKFDPDDGSALPAPTRTAGNIWIPPFGNDEDGVRGLRRTQAALTLAAGRRHSETTDPERTRPLPPVGRHEFFVLPADAGSMELMALDAEQGALHLWLASDGNWATLEQLDGGFLADSPLPHAAWRCEVVIDRNGSPRIFLPTGNGLACLQPDLLRLGYHVTYVGDAPCSGAPMLWRDEVWSVLRTTQGSVRLQAMQASSGLPGTALELAGIAPDEQFSPPACTRRQVIWPGRHGRIVLQVQPDGSLSARYIPWPPGISPKFDFGSAFLTSSGQLWQACWSEHDQAHAYLRLDGRDHELHLASAPRLCTGQINYRLAARMKLPPWEDPERGSDADSGALFVPILESAVDAGVLGVRIQTTNGLETTLASGERIRSVLELHSDRKAETGLQVLNLAKPWLGRAFIHEHTLWFYHPELKWLAGWELER